jgi:two-component system nitrogen regulation response regulator NtrX
VPHNQSRHIVPGVAGPAPRILIVDDQRAVREELAFALSYRGFRTAEAQDGQQALALVAAGDVAVILLDVKMPGLDGLEVLTLIKRDHPDLPIVMISGHGDLDTAVLAVKKGAYDFLQKPFDTDRVLLSVQNALRRAVLEHENTALLSENERLRRTLAKEVQLFGAGPAMTQLRQLIDKVAPTDAQVLITGENGTGKELVAQSIHALSARSRGPFVVLNCAAIPAELVESELFGHEQGAFTGADSARAGHFEVASGGTLFLDEVGDMALPAQAKLLRAVQERAITRVGGSRTIPVDVRVLAATNQDLEAMVRDKSFREDLYWRLHVVRLHVPALRERLEDLPQLAGFFLEQACARNGLPVRTLQAPALDWLRGQAFPGNVRQLKNLLEGAAIVAEGPEITVADLQAMLAQPPGRAAGAPDWFAYASLEEFRAATEKEFIRRKILENHGNIKRTAERIGIQRSNLYKRLDRYGLK